MNAAVFGAGRILRLAEVDSTMDEARRQARAGAAEGLWILAERQLKARGRRGRAWLSETGDLAATAVLRPGARRPELAPGETATLSFIAALALGDALRALGLKAPISLKWPNDVLAGGRKIAGILLEAETAPPPGWLGLGVGVNLGAPPPPAALEPEATAPTGLQEHGLAVAPEEALAALIAAFDPRYARWLAEGFAGQRDEWLARAAGLGAPLVARLGETRIEGVFRAIDEDGALLLETAAGLRRVHAAQIFLAAGASGLG